MLSEQHVAAGHQDRLGGDVVIIGDKQTAFAAIDVLVGLGAEAADCAKGAGGAPVPVRAHGVGTVLDQRDAQVLAQGSDGVQVRYVATHVGEQQHLGATCRCLSFEVGQVDGVIVGHFDQYPTGVGVRDRTRHWRQGEGAAQHRIAALDTQGLQGGEQGGATELIATQYLAPTLAANSSSSNAVSEPRPPVSP